MKVTKEQIVNGVASYGKNEIMAKSSDKSFKFLVSVGLATLKRKPDIVSSILDSKLAGFVVAKDENGMYDIDTIADIVSDAMSEYGNLEIVVPPVPLLNPKEVTLTFTPNDVKVVANAIHSAVEGGM